MVDIWWWIYQIMEKKELDELDIFLDLGYLGIRNDPKSTNHKTPNPLSFGTSITSNTSGRSFQVSAQPRCGEVILGKRQPCYGEDAAFKKRWNYTMILYNMIWPDFTNKQIVEIELAWFIYNIDLTRFYRTMEIVQFKNGAYHSRPQIMATKRRLGLLDCLHLCTNATEQGLWNTIIHQRYEN